MIAQLSNPIAKEAKPSPFYAQVSPPLGRVSSATIAPPFALLRNYTDCRHNATWRSLITRDGSHVEKTKSEDVRESCILTLRQNFLRSCCLDPPNTSYIRQALECKLQQMWMCTHKEKTLLASDQNKEVQQSNRVQLQLSLWKKKKERKHANASHIFSVYLPTFYATCIQESCKMASNCFILFSAKCMIW